MKLKNKDQNAILQKLGIKKLNQMQEDAYTAISLHSEIILKSPTGTGKTLAILLPIIAELDNKLDQIQALIIVPSRELAIQIEQVIRDMGSGYKTNAIYGGRAGSKDKLDLKHPPAILIGTPGRIAAQIRSETIETHFIKTLVLDEFDKSLEIGFEEELKEILKSLKSLTKKILTSATQKVQIPKFIELAQPKKLNYLGEEKKLLTIKTVLSSSQDKLPVLEKLVLHTGNGSGIIFCNLKDEIQLVSNFLQKKNISLSCFYGDMEQIDRERALIKFKNGTNRLLVATDLAARGIDVPEMDFIIHFQLPLKKDEFIHRNGRTARMNKNGTSYIIKWEKEELPEFIKDFEIVKLKTTTNQESISWDTLYISGGRKDKISKGDIAGLFFKQGKLQKHELGVIDLKQDCAYVAIPSSKKNELIKLLNNSKLKQKKVRISFLE